METDVTRLLSASMYTNDIFRNKIIGLTKDRYHNISESIGTDTSLILKHAVNARRKERKINYILFIPTLLFAIAFLYLLASNDEMAVAIMFLLFLLSYIIVLYFDVKKTNFLLKEFSKDTFNTSFDIKDSLLKDIDNKISENIIYYSGYSPFVGRGIDVGAWSFVVDIDRAKKVLDKKTKIKAFDIEELYQAIEDKILSLNIKNLAISDKIYVNGKEIRDDRLLLPKINGHPINRLDEENFELASKNENTNIRRYKIIEVVDWDGDLILSNFIRFQKTDTNLFVESNYFLLPPISDKFRDIDNRRKINGLVEAITWMMKNVVMTLFYMLFSLFKVMFYFQTGFANMLGIERRSMEKQVIRSNNYDYGSTTSIRESVAQTKYLQHFQYLDKEMHYKTIEKRILNGLSDFLESKGIDTSDFKDRETSIINSGVIVTGGSVSGENIAVGKKSTIKSTKTKNK